MQSNLGFWLRLGLALALFALLVPSFIFTWQSISAAVDSDGYCADSRTVERFTYAVEATSPKVHIPVSEVTAGGECAVAVSTYTDLETPGGETLDVNSTSGQLGPADSLSWTVGTDVGPMGRLVQTAMGLAVLLAIGSLLILCLQEEEEEEEDKGGDIIILNERDRD